LKAAHQVAFFYRLLPAMAQHHLSYDDQQYGGLYFITAILNRHAVSDSCSISIVAIITKTPMTCINFRKRCSSDF
jgi:hypothetical protein